MPNVCDNRLTIWCDDIQTMEVLSESAQQQRTGLVRRLVLGLFAARQDSTTGFLEFLCPTPKNLGDVELEITPERSQQTKCDHWRLANWGCRHDFVVEKVKRTGNEMKLEFPTDYSPPVQALQHGARIHCFRFRLLYCEPGGGFCGIATETANHEYELMFNKPPLDVGIPQELIDAFDLNAIFKENLED